MRGLVWRAFALWVPASFVCACTTMSTVPPGDLRAAVERLHSGDRIAVHLAGDEAWEEGLTIVGVTEARVQTEGPRGARRSFEKDAIDGIRIREHAPGRTIALALGVYFGSLYGLCGNPFTRHPC